MNENLKERVQKLGLHGILANWSDYFEVDWLENLVVAEENERGARGLKRRIKQAKLGQFKPMADFDWKWPKHIDRQQIQEILSLEFIPDATNIIIVGPNGVGKTMIVKNLIHKAVLSGKTGIFTTASEMLQELASKDGSLSRKRCLLKYTRPQLLAIDELGYLSYDNRYADLLFEVINHRYEANPTIITTNKIFADWNEVFPNASCVVTLVDRLVHHSEITNIDADSFRLKDSLEQAEARRKSRKKVGKK